MHYSNLVIVPKDGKSPKEHVDEILAPHCEETSEDGWWDWYQIGARWSGILTGYDPMKDPRNVEVCWLCKGTGTRTDMVVKDGCNGCQGTGKKVVWSTQFAEYPGDVQPIENVPEEIYATRIYRVVEPDGKYFEQEDKPTLEELKNKYPGYLVVVVDNHS